MTTPHAPAAPPPNAAVLKALALPPVGRPEARAEMLLVLEHASFPDLLDALRILYAAARSRSHSQGDPEDRLARSLNVALAHNDLLWVNPEPSRIPAQAAALPYSPKGGA